MRSNSAATAGRSSPLGATAVDGGVNFSLYSRSGTGVELLFFDREDDARPARVIRIDRAANRTYHYWHVFVPGVQPGQIYGYRVAGPFDPANGMRFDPAKILLDPYGRAVTVPRGYSREAARAEGDNTASAMKSVVKDRSRYANYSGTGNTLNANHPIVRRMIVDSLRYWVEEMHVDGFRFDLASILARDASGQR